MYKLVLADDEAKIRTLLSELINWNELGFEVAGVFADGSEVMEYIKQNPVDCVLCDIRMTPVSGLDVAEYIYNNKPHIKIMLMSGFQEFSYASAALKYGVENYFLKPVRINEIKKALSELKKNLDREKSNSEIISLYKRDVLTKLISGIYIDDTSINAALHSIDPDISSICACAVATLKIDVSDTKDSVSIANILSNVADFHSDRTHIYFVNYNGDLARYILFAEIASENSFRNNINGICESLTEILGVSPYLTDFSYYKTVSDLCAYIADSNSKAGEDFYKYDSLILNAINSGNTSEADDIFGQLSKQLTLVGYTKASQYCRDAANKIKKELNADIKMVGFDNAFDLFASELNASSNISEVIKAFETLLKSLTEIMQNTDIQIKNILKVRNYIAEHYMEDLYLEKVSQMANLSPSWFSSSFKNVTGQSFISFIISCRINAAKEMLISTDKKIYEISNAVGYRNIRSFTKLFNLNCGMSPTEYRNKFSKGGLG